MSLKWAYVDQVDRVLRLPDSKTGAKVVHLGQPAVELLRDAQHIGGNSWVITGTLEGKPLNDLLAAGSRPSRTEGRPHPRPPAHVRLYRGRRRPGPHNDRQAPRTHAGADHRTLCSLSR